MMRIKVTFYGVLKDDTGSIAEEYEMHGPATVRSVVNTISDRYEKVRERLTSIAYVVNDELVDIDQSLADGDEVGLLPPVSGG